MLSVFALRLALGLLLALLLLSPRQVEARYYRTQFLVVLGLTALAAAFAWENGSQRLHVALGMSLAFAFAGSFVWSIRGTPGGRVSVLLASVALGASLWLMPTPVRFALHAAWARVDDLTAAAVLGLAMSAMLLGHSYLIAPTMSIVPLLRLCVAFFVAVGMRVIFAASMLWLWTEQQSVVKLTDVTALWLPLRWAAGILGPAVLGWMAYESAKIRSTQSATGILYVVVIFCFLGELTSLLLCRQTGFPL